MAGLYATLSIRLDAFCSLSDSEGETGGGGGGGGVRIEVSGNASCGVDRRAARRSRYCTRNLSRDAPATGLTSGQKYSVPGMRAPLEGSKAALSTW